MPLIRINAEDRTPVLHGIPRPLAPVLQRALASSGPIILMLHGYKFLPGDPRHCPHTHIFSTRPTHDCPRALSWPRALGFGQGRKDEGLAIAFGWPARGRLRAAQARSETAAEALASLITLIHRLAPDRPVHIIAHSLGCHLALSALKHLPHGSVGRMILLNGATYQSHAHAALATEAGRTAELFNIISRENAPYDFLFEKTLPSPIRGDRALGRGLRAPTALTLCLDDSHSRQHLAALGHIIAPRNNRSCHWSTYLRPGVFDLYSALIRTPERLPLAHLQNRLVPLAQERRTRRLAFLPPMLHLGRNTPG